jgi:hypothetical protein
MISNSLAYANLGLDHQFSINMSLCVAVPRLDAIWLRASCDSMRVAASLNQLQPNSQKDK